MKKRYFFIFLFTCLLITNCITSQIKEEAQELYEKAIRLMDEEQKYDEAINTLKQAQKIDPETIVFPYEIAYAYYLKGDYTQAIKTAESLTERRDTFSEIYRLIGNSYDMSGNKENAVETYKKGLERFPNAGTLYHELGVVEVNNKNTVKGILYFEKGISVNPEYGTNYYELAKIFCNSSEKIWGVLYGEIFMHIDPASPKTSEISRILYNTYFFALDVADPKHKSVSFSRNVVIDPNLKELPFTANFEMNMALCLVNVKKINLESLCEIRKNFIKNWFKKGFDKKYPNILFDWQKKAIDKGYFEIYNYWMFNWGAEDEYNIWLYDNFDDFRDFAKWFKKNSLEPDKSRYFLRTDYSSSSDSLAMNWKTQEDYVKDELKILYLIKWLEDNTFYEDNDFRKKVAGYVLAWFVGEQYFTLTVNGELLYEDGEDYEGRELVLGAYTFAKGAYLINNKDNPDELKANIEGVKRMMKIYDIIVEKNPSVSSSLMQKYKELKTDEELGAFIQSRLKK